MPVLVGLALGERLAPWASVGIALALLAVVLVAAEGGLPSLIDDGTYGKILESYELQSGAVDEATINAGTE